MSELALITNVNVGTRDMGFPVLWFDVCGPGWGSLQVFRLDSAEALEILGSVERLEELERHPCRVAKQDGQVVFLELWKP